MKFTSFLCVFLVLSTSTQSVYADGDWEVTPDSEAALARGLDWLARTQGPEGNWESNDLGLVGMGALAFLAAGHSPGHGKYGEAVDRALNYVLKNAKPSGLLNISNAQRDMYNHGLAAFVLGQAHGMTNDARISPVLDRALKLIAYTQCEDGGWDYQARRQLHGHDLSLVVMQAKALRSAVDSGLEVSPEVIDLAIKSVREHYRAASGKKNFDDPAVRAEKGQFTYDGNRGTPAMAACGVVCLQEFGEYDQVGGRDWEQCYPKLRDTLVANQHVDVKNPLQDGDWTDTSHVHGKPGQLYGTAVACFILAIPNRYLPILQEGKIDSLRGKFQKD